MKDNEVPEQGGTEPPREPPAGASRANWADIRRDAELQRWVDDTLYEWQKPPRQNYGSSGFFLQLGLALPYIAAMLGVLALVLFLSWAIRTFW